MRLFRVCLHDGGPPFKYETQHHFHARAKSPRGLLSWRARNSYPQASLPTFDKFATKFGKQSSDKVTEMKVARETTKAMSSQECSSSVGKRRRETHRWVGWCSYLSSRSQKTHWISFRRCWHSWQQCPSPKIIPYRIPQTTMQGPVGAGVGDAPKIVGRIGMKRFPCTRERRRPSDNFADYNLTSERVVQESTNFHTQQDNRGFVSSKYRKSENLWKVRWIWQEWELVGERREDDGSLHSRIG